MTTTRVCNTPGCGRSTPSVEHAYCRDCIGVVLRTGRPPVLEPRWRTWTREHNAGKDMTGSGRAA